MNNTLGIVAALLSSALGGTAGAITRYLIGASDPETLAYFRFGVAFVLLLPVAILTHSRWPPRADILAAAAWEVVHFALFFFLYNLAMSFTTAARGSLALATLPLTTMLVAAALVGEPIGLNLVLGVVAVAVGIRLASTDSSIKPAESPAKPFAGR
jgi:drug/metabolite transporter (DMT)-like permease